MQGWIKVERRLQEHWIWSKDKPFDIRSAWLDMLLMANHKDNRFPLGSEMIFVPRGSFVTSERRLGERWQWSNTKVRSFLKLLENDNMIVKNTDSKKSTITIVNYSLYQESESTKTSEEHQTDSTGASQKHTNKNDKNVKNVKEKIYKENNRANSQTDEKIYYSEDELLNQTILEFIEFRKKIKAPMTTHAIDLLIRKLNQLGENSDDKIEILNQSIMNGWKSVFPLKQEAIHKRESRPMHSTHSNIIEQMVEESMKVENINYDELEEDVL